MAWYDVSPCPVRQCCRSDVFLDAGRLPFVFGCLEFPHTVLMREGTVMLWRLDGDPESTQDTFIVYLDMILTGMCEASGLTFTADTVHIAGNVYRTTFLSNSEL